jgi:hypothetical protein
MESYEAYYFEMGGDNKPWSFFYSFTLDPGTYDIAYIYEFYAGTGPGGRPPTTYNALRGYINIDNDNNFIFYDKNNIRIFTNDDTLYLPNRVASIYILTRRRTYDFPDAQLTTAINFANIGYGYSSYDPFTIGPNYVIPFRNGFLLENGANQSPPVFVSFGGTVTVPSGIYVGPADGGFNNTNLGTGYPICEDLIDSSIVWYVDTHYKLIYKIYRDTINAVRVGQYTDNVNGPYSMSHDVINDRLIITGGSDRNFWEGMSAEYTLTLQAIYLANLRTTTFPLDIVIIDIPIPQNSDTIGKGGWAVDFDNMGNLYAAFTSGEICKINLNTQTTSIIARGFIEPWSVYIIDKNSSTPHIIICNTRGGSVDLLYPDGTVSTIIGETNLLWIAADYNKHVTDGGISQATFGCPTRIILYNGQFIIGDETGCAIRILTSPKLIKLVNDLNTNTLYITPNSPLNLLGFNAGTVSSDVTIPFDPYVSIFIENVGTSSRETLKISYKIPVQQNQSTTFWNKNNKNVQLLKCPDGRLANLNIKVLDRHGNQMFSDLDWSLDIKIQRQSA